MRHLAINAREQIVDVVALQQPLAERAQNRALVPYKIAGKERNQKTMRVIRDGVPVIDQFSRDAVVDGDQQGSDDGIGQPAVFSSPGRFV